MMALRRQNGVQVRMLHTDDIAIEDDAKTRYVVRCGPAGQQQKVYDAINKVCALA